MTDDAGNPTQSGRQGETHRAATDQTQPSATRTGDTGRSATDGEDVLVQTTPTVRPTLIRLVLTMGVGIVALGTLFVAPELLGSRERTNLALVVVQLLLVVAIVRLVIEYVVLQRTKYVVTDDVVCRQFSLAGRTKSKEVPLPLIRSAERTQSRFEYVLGVGSIVLNQGLGNLKLRAVPNHERVYGVVHDRLCGTTSDQTHGKV